MHSNTYNKFFIRFCILVISFVINSVSSSSASTDPGNNSSVYSNIYNINSECQAIYDKIPATISPDIDKIIKFNIIQEEDLPFNYQNIILNLSTTNLMVANSICTIYINTEIKKPVIEIEEKNLSCLIDRFYNSLNHLHSLTTMINNINTPEDAKKKSALIKEMLLYYVDTYYAEFENRCDFPSPPLLELKKANYAKQVIDIIMSRLDKILINNSFSSNPVTFSDSAISMTFSDIDEQSRDILLQVIGKIKQNHLDVAFNSLEYGKYLNKDPAKMHHIIGSLHYLKRNYKQALAEFNTSTKINPDNYLAWFYIGIIMNESGRKEEAVNAFESALEISPDFYMGWFQLANTLYDLGRRDEAMSNFEISIKVNPNFYYSWFYLGLIYEEEHQYKEAKMCFKEVLKINKNHIASYNRLIRIYKKGNELNEIIDEYKMILRFKDDYVAHLVLGVAYKHLQQYDKAISEFKKALKIEPNIVSYSYLGLIYQGTGDFEQAIKEFEKTIWLDPGFAQGYYNLGSVYEYNKGGRKYGTGFRKQKAISSFEKAIALDHTFADAYNKLGLIYLNTGEFKLAIGQFKRAVKTNPFFVESYSNLIKAYKQGGIPEDSITGFDSHSETASDIAIHNLAGLLFQIQGEINKAAVEFKKSIAISPNPVSHNFLGEIYLIKDEKKKALDEFEKSLQINPRIAETHYNKGLIYYRNNDLTRAIELFEKSADLKPDFSLAYFMSGNIYNHLEEYDKAIFLYNKALSIDPSMVEALKKEVHIYKKKGVLHEQINKYKDLIALEPSYLLYNKLGIAYSIINRKDSALIQFKKAKNLMPNITSYNFMGKIFEETDMMEKAIDAYTTASILLPNVTSELKLGNIYAYKNKHKRALVNYKKAIELDSGNIGIRLKYASMFEYNNDGIRFGNGFNFTEAINQYEKAIEIQPNFAETYYRIALIYSNIGKIKKSIKYNELALSFSNDFMPAIRQLRDTYQKLNEKKIVDTLNKRILDIALAESILNKKQIATNKKGFFMSDDDLAKKYYLLGISYYNKGNIYSAIDQYKRAISKDPKFLEAYYNLGVVYQEKGIWDKAVEVFNKTVLINPEVGETYNNLGLIYEYIGEYANSIVNFKKAIETDTSFVEALKNLSRVYEKKGDRKNAALMQEKYMRLTSGKK